MLKLSRMTDYAMAILCQMAREGGGAVLTASRLAESTGLPPPSVAKLLKTLARQGIVAASRGATGGYRLARRPDTVSVRDVVQAVEGPVALAACVDGGCDAGTRCPARGRWRPVNAAVDRALAGVSLADMACAPLAGEEGAGEEVAGGEEDG